MNIWFKRTVLTIYGSTEQYSQYMVQKNSTHNKNKLNEATKIELQNCQQNLILKIQNIKMQNNFDILDYDEIV